MPVPILHTVTDLRNMVIPVEDKPLSQLLPQRRLQICVRQLISQRQAAGYICPNPGPNPENGFGRIDADGTCIVPVQNNVLQHEIISPSCHFPDMILMALSLIFYVYPSCPLLSLLYAFFPAIQVLPHCLYIDNYQQ